MALVVSHCMVSNNFSLILPINAYDLSCPKISQELIFVDGYLSVPAFASSDRLDMPVCHKFSDCDSIHYLCISVLSLADILSLTFWFDLFDSAPLGVHKNNSAVPVIDRYRLVM